jgi:hypothetical protein
MFRSSTKLELIDPMISQDAPSYVPAVVVLVLTARRYSTALTSLDWPALTTGM